MILHLDQLHIIPQNVYKFRPEIQISFQVFSISVTEGGNKIFFIVLSFTFELPYSLSSVLKTWSAVPEQRQFLDHKLCNEEITEVIIK